MPQDKSAYDPRSAQCYSVGMHGRCQLRGTIGKADASGGRWMCAWHHQIDYEGRRWIGDDGKPLSLRLAFEKFLSEEREQGATRWDHRISGDWWDLIQGAHGPGGFDSRTTEAKLPQSEEERPGY
jgi:hypothetical protein